MLEKSPTKTEDLQNLKRQLRQVFRLKRQSLSLERRKEASSSLLSLLDLIKSFQKICSFKSFKEEISTEAFNTILFQEKRLYLPEMVNDEIIFSHGQEILTNFSSTVIIVPGIAFDKSHYRLGYGKGHYDRLLAKIPNVPTIGIGFKEQWIEKLPHEAHDVALTRVELF